VNTGGSPTRPKPPTPPISPARRGRLLLYVSVPFHDDVMTYF
jgi:hypothetical protein